MKLTHILLAAISVCTLCSCTSPNRHADDRMYESLHDATQAHDDGQLTDDEYAEIRWYIIQKHYRDNRSSCACKDSERK